MTAEEMRQDIELKVVELIKEKLADGSMTEERSQQMAQHVLDTLKPGMSFEEIYKVLGSMDNHYPELSGVILPALREYEENVVTQVQDGVRDLIRQGQYDAAEKLARKAITQDVDVVWQASAKPEPTTPTTNPQG